MADILKQTWWTLLLRGIVAVLIALVLLFAPEVALATGAISFALLFGIYALVDGFSTLASALMRREGQWILLIVLGLVGVIAGFITLANPLLFAILSVTIMVYIVAFKAIAGGIVEIISAWQLRKEIDGEWFLMLNGLFSVLFGLILLVRPIIGVEVLVIFAAFFLLVSGIMQVLLSFKVRDWSSKVQAA